MSDKVQSALEYDLKTYGANVRPEPIEHLCEVLFQLLAHKRYTDLQERFKDDSPAELLKALALLRDLGRQSQAAPVGTLIGVSGDEPQTKTRKRR